MKLKYPLSVLAGEIYTKMYESVKETMLGVTLQKDGMYHFVKQSDIEDYAIRCYRVALDKINVEKINNKLK